MVVMLPTASCKTWPGNQQEGTVASNARSADQIADDIAQTRTRLAGTIDQLVYRAHPKTIAKREVGSIKSRFVKDDGKPDLAAIGKVAGIAVGVIAALVLLRKVVG
jgi:hypothetical protein